MTLQLELSPELEAELERSAQSHGQSVEEFILEAARERTRREAPGPFSDLLGRMKGQLPSVDEFLAEKHADTEREEAKLDARL